MMSSSSPGATSVVKPGHNNTTTTSSSLMGSSRKGRHNDAINATANVFHTPKNTSSGPPQFADPSETELRQPVLRKQIHQNHPLTFATNLGSMENGPEIKQEHPDSVMSLADQESRVSAYARLDFEEFTFYVQTLQVMLGRRAENGSGMVDVHLGPQKAISRKHAKIFYNFGNQRFELSVLGRNGVFIGSAFIPMNSTVALEDGAQIQIADITFKFVLPNGFAREEDPEDTIRPTDALSLQDRRNLQASPAKESQSPEAIEEAPTLVTTTPTAPKAKKENGGSKRQPKIEYRPEDIPEEYRTKPEKSYSSLIAHALQMRDAVNGLSLADIYKAIQEDFPFYKYCPAGWQNSVRHNLSSNKAFRKVSKEGKGFLWGLDQEYFLEKERQRKRAAEQKAAAQQRAQLQAQQKAAAAAAAAAATASTSPSTTTIAAPTAANGTEVPVIATALNIDPLLAPPPPVQLPVPAAPATASTAAIQSPVSDHASVDATASGTLTNAIGTAEQAMTSKGKTIAEIAREIEVNRSKDAKRIYNPNYSTEDYEQLRRRPSENQGNGTSGLSIQEQLQANIQKRASKDHQSDTASASPSEQQIANKVPHSHTSLQAGQSTFRMPKVGTTTNQPHQPHPSAPMNIKELAKRPQMKVNSQVHSAPQQQQQQQIPPATSARTRRDSGSSALASGISPEAQRVLQSLQHMVIKKLPPNISSSAVLPALASALSQAARAEGGNTTENINKLLTDKNSQRLVSLLKQTLENMKSTKKAQDAKAEDTATPSPAPVQSPVAAAATSSSPRSHPAAPTQPSDEIPGSGATTEPASQAHSRVQSQEPELKPTPVVQSSVEPQSDKSATSTPAPSEQSVSTEAKIEQLLARAKSRPNPSEKMKEGIAQLEARLAALRAKKRPNDGALPDMRASKAIKTGDGS